MKEKNGLITQQIKTIKENGENDGLQHFFLFLYFSKTFMVINPFPNKPWFLRVCSTSLLKTLWEKEKLLVMSNFSFSHSVFYPIEVHSSIFINFEIVVCTLSDWKSLKFVFWDRVNVENSMIKDSEKSV